MHATIHRHHGVTGSTEEVMRAGRELAATLSGVSGFISCALLEAGDAVIVAVCVFETEEALTDGERLAGLWHEKQPALLPRPPEVTAGEVIVQRGM